ncbi:hypothetical protein Taro_046146 [Colocasia esculenta]|uniref:Uncharacterized protein n=1 Tax=Colocasia esculenta TaxID=4460 RepID=A0A843WP16_COLES|nr:hypothetical protein [Colocasia esculenta]
MALVFPSCLGFTPNNLTRVPVTAKGAVVTSTRLPVPDLVPCNRYYRVILLACACGGVLRSVFSWGALGWFYLWALNLVEVLGGYACGETFLLTWLLSVPCGDTWLFLPNLVEVWDVGACVVRLWSHVVAPVFRELIVSTGACRGLLPHCV